MTAFRQVTIGLKWSLVWLMYHTNINTLKNIDLFERMRPNSAVNRDYLLKHGLENAAVIIEREVQCTLSRVEGLNEIMGTVAR